MGLPGGERLRSWVGRQAMRRGLLGDSRLWLAVFVAGRVVRLVRWAAGPRRAPVVFSQKLAPGSAVVIRHLRRGRG